jgi:hypothetical protein
MQHGPVDRIFMGLMKEHYSESIRQMKDLYFFKTLKKASAKFILYAIQAV